MLCHWTMKEGNHLLAIGLYFSSPSNALSLKYEARQSPPRHRPVPFKPLECSVTELWSKTITSSPSACTFQAPRMLCHWTMKQDNYLLVIGLYLSSPSNCLSLNYEGRQSPPRHRPVPFKPLECSVSELWSKIITSSSSAFTFQAPQTLCHLTMKQNNHLLVIGLYLSSPSNALSLNYKARQSPPRPRPLSFKRLECSITELWSKTIASSSSAFTSQAPRMLCHWTTKQDNHGLVLRLDRWNPSNALSLNYEAWHSLPRPRPVPSKPLKCSATKLWSKTTTISSSSTFMLAP